MSESARLYLITPVLEDASFAPTLAEACKGGEVAAVLLRLNGDERSLTNLVKALAPSAQDHGAAVIVAAEGEVDLANVAVRGGADGVHVSGASPALVRDLRERLKVERAIGVSGIRTKDDAMTLGEAGVDYLLFGEPRRDGSLPSLESVTERASWWAQIFETPCVAYAPSLGAIPTLAATHAEFIALGDAVWNHAEGPAAAVKAAAETLARLDGSH